MSMVVESASIDDLAKSVYSIKLGDLNYEESLQLAEKYKEEGNAFFKENKLQLACDKYTCAINLNIETKKNAIYYSNRAIVNLKLENTGLTIEDAKKAIEIDPTYIKAYYRRASAQVVLQHYDEALKDFNHVLSLHPDDADLKDKISKCQKAKRKKQWWESVSSEGRTSSNPKVNLKGLYESSKVETTYTGQEFPADGKISQEWIEELIENMKNNKFIHKKYLLQILIIVKELYTKEQSLVNITIPDDKEFNVCGDIHGQFYDLLNIFKINGYPSLENPYLFNGDFVDRGSFSVECITTLLCYKILYPNSFHLARGNHESRNLNKLYGFEGEVKNKYDASVYECFCEFFFCLPLGHVLNEKVLVVHGGLFSNDGVKLDDIRKVNRFCEPPEKGIMSEILWSDPCKTNGRSPSKRGVGMAFGPDIAAKFLEDNKLELLVRSHEVKQEGYEVEPGGKVITVFSAPNYCDQMGNKGALIKFKGSEMKPKFVQFSDVPHPKVPAMKYANPWMFM